MKKKLLVVGAFNAKKYGVIGGIARSCDELMSSQFSDYFDVIPIDSTQRSNPPPGIFRRLQYALVRLLTFTFAVVKNRPQGVLLFTSSGFSFIEKCIMAWMTRSLGGTAFLFPRAGALIDWAYSSHVSLIFAKILMKGSSVFLAQGPSWQKFAIDVGGFSTDKVITIANWTAVQSQIRAGDRKLTSESFSAVPTLAFVGWLEKEKGILELLDAYRLLSESGLCVRLLIAGDGSERDHVSKFISMHGLGDSVSLLGWLDSGELTEVYEKSDIFVLPSWSEGLPNALIEAMSFGLCPVVTRVGMIPDYLKDGIHGKLVNVKDVHGLAHALQAVIKNHKFRRSCARSAHDLANSFSSERVIPLLCAAIDKHLC